MLRPAGVHGSPRRCFLGAAASSSRFRGAFSATLGCEEAQNPSRTGVDSRRRSETCLHDVQHRLSRCRPCPQFYLMDVSVLRPAVHSTLLNIGNMSAIPCTSRSVPPVPTVDDLYC
ncbi:hypothetical protein MTO96_021266 [Rhipicephalus appendiculatus]